MIYTVANTKGGVGKTTLSVQLALSLALQGREVLLIDGDRQGTASLSIAARSEAGRHPLVACAQYTDGPMLRGQLQAQRSKYDDIVIDVGGRDSTALRAALGLTDILIVPFAPRSYDVWALDDIIGLVDEALSMRDKFPIKAVLNLADPGERSTDNAEAAEAVKGYEQIEYMPTPIRRRKSLANASALGLHVSEMSPKDARAVEEIKSFVNNLTPTEQ